MGSGSTELGAAGPGQGTPIPWTTTSTHPLGAGSIPKVELLPTCCFLPSAAGPLVTPMRWSMTCMRCSKEPGSSPSLFSRCLFCRTDTALPGAQHPPQHPQHPPACLRGAQDLNPSPAPRRRRHGHNPAGMSPSHRSGVPTSPCGARLTPPPAPLGGNSTHGASRTAGSAAVAR